MSGGHVYGRHDRGRGEGLGSVLPRYGSYHPRAALALAQARHGGLWNSGIIVWRGLQYSIGESWLAEVMAWSASDQIALPYVLWQAGVKPTELPGHVYECPWFRYTHHGQ